MTHIALTVVAEDLPNGERFAALHDSETGELIDVAVAAPQTECARCGRCLGPDEMAWGIKSKLYCDPCGDVVNAEAEAG